MWTGLIGLLIAGLYLRGVVRRTFGRPRHPVKVERREPVLIESVAVNQPPPLVRSPSLVPDRSSTDYRVLEVEAALRKLARRLRRPRSTPFKTIPPLTVNEAKAARASAETPAPTSPPKLPA